ncbi:hypothetical protein CHS0354_034366 [Potamilus streckersoni]|uniref:MIB/HERC2 domain-containing protein n=1 Tax=Potamilus streckersoni TaxID=2493646 RepID=A0AAE0WGE3_9BIVA|nr:hypothetical protein CHS0354_034366 [Potamilus streckersoni]
MGPVCASCTGVTNPSLCNHLRVCESSQYCYVEKFIDSNGDQHFNLGCRSQQACSTYLRTRALGHNVTVNMEDHSISCLECCSSDLCNSFGCGEPGYPSSMGPVCASCTGVTNPSLCNHLRVCESSQVCNVHQFVELSDTLYTSECMSQYECSGQLASGASIIGKRHDSNLSKQRVSRASWCNKCCQDNLCNLDCKVCGTNIGTWKRVTRGPTWIWGEQDGGEGNQGTVIGTLSGYFWMVTWDLGESHSYRMGEGFQDLCIL